MNKVIERIRSSCAVLAVIGIVASCSSPKAGHGDVTSTSSALTTSNGLDQNGLTTNGLLENGFWSNGFWSNGFWSNGFWSNGFWSNGFWSNGFWSNGFWSNGLGSNGFWSNGFWSNGFWSNGLNGTPNVRTQILRSNGYARQLLQYMYSCAMPATTYDTTLDPSDGVLLMCTVDTDCELGYSCEANKCVIPLRGAGANGSGLGVNADGTTWWADGTCDESCQRWVSACVLARTNAYGVHVPISMRAPPNAPLAIKQALDVTDVERNGDATHAAYSLREGAFFGNIFATTPVNPAPSPTPPNPTPADGPIVSTPRFFACAGPGSNIPQVTKRFCSSQGDQSVISVPGLCLKAAPEGGTCAGEDTDPASDTFGAMFDCHTSATTATQVACADYRDPSCYNEVITVYLTQPITTCNNAVCEPPEDATSCPSDCHPGTWAKTFSHVFLEQTLSTSGNYVASALDPSDGSHVLAGSLTATQPVDFGGGFVPGGPLGIVRILADGSYDSTRSRGLAPTPSITRVNAVAVDGAGNIVVLGFRPSPGTIWLGKFDAAGNLLPSWPITLGGNTGIIGLNGMTLAIDGAGNLLVAAMFNGTAAFPTGDLTGPATNTNNRDLLVLKVSSTGAVLWAVTLGPGFGGGNNLPIVSDADGNVIVGKDLVPPDIANLSHLYKLSGLDGSVLWDSQAAGRTEYCALAVDGSGDIYATLDNNFPEGSLAKFSALDGSLVWTEVTPFYFPANVCRGDHHVLTFAADGTLINAAKFGGSYSPVANFPSGAFSSYALPDLLIAGYSTSDTVPSGQTRLRWAKHLPMVLYTRLDGMSIDENGLVFVSGVYSGSMQVDDVFLVTQTPAQTTVANAFLASFAAPSVLDTTPPVIGIGADATGTQFNTVPADIVVPATDPAGANVFFMPPTASDSGNTGTTVSCTPAPNTMFMVGTTQVVCIASDPLGNNDLATFNVTVLDTFGPVFSSAGDVTVPATDSNGAIVTYTPIATDQVSGDRPVTCTPPSGSLFAIGSHTVTCSASDAASNPSQVQFAVIVTDVVAAVGSCASAGDGAACDDGDACTQFDTCQAGTCVGAYPVICAASDQCHVAGTCDPATGACSNPAAPNGSGCSDGNACTQTDTCQAGACVGVNPVTCAASDQCHVAGTCNPATGACSNPAAPDGTGCSDGNACTQSDVCLAGACMGANPVTCVASDQCHVAGICNPATGACSNPAAPNGTTCSDNNACTAGDACTAGSCVSGGAVSCDDQNPCTVDSCAALTGCAHAPGNAGAICRAAANACDSAEVCTGSSATCPASADKLPPTLAPGTNQTLVGNCSGSAVAFSVPSLPSSSCESGTNVTCNWTLGSSHGTCAKSGSGASLPGNSYGAYAVSCTAKDAAGNTSASVAFTVTVLQPLTIKIQPPLSGDNGTVNNVVKLGSTVPNKVALYACGTNVTKTASVTAKIGTTLVSSGGATSSQTVATCTSTPDTGGVMIFDGTFYRYNLSTKGLQVTAGVPAFYQENITVAYKSAPSVVVGSDNIQVDVK